MNPAIVAMVVCLLWAMTAALLIARYLERRGRKVGLVWLRLRMFEHVQEYRALTLAETGRVGALFYHYVIPMCLILILVVVMLVNNVWR